jgi:peptidoglycan hydrolase-like protein with peptidoglycan-binding domain
VVEIVPVSARPVAAAPSPAPSAGASARYAAVQRALNNIGYGPVVESGVVDDATADAIRRFELDNGLPLTGRPEDRVVNRLISIGAMEAI